MADRIQEIIGAVKGALPDIKIYYDSINSLEESIVFIGKISTRGKRLFIVSPTGKRSDLGFVIDSFIEAAGLWIGMAQLSHENAAALRRRFSFTAPRVMVGLKTSIGLGDRLGLATPGHLRLIKGLGVFPVLAQQSIRELNLTGRTYEDVLDDVSWGVFQEGYRDGFGADGDHLKNSDEIEMALRLGFTMITLDCSEKINNAGATMPEAQLDSLLNGLPAGYLEAIEKRYLGQKFGVRNFDIEFDASTLKRLIAVYGEAIDFTAKMYCEIVRPSRPDIDFEISIDETMTPTTPEAHFFVANELKLRGVAISSLAPRFCGEFQKGIDYIGSIEEFEREFKFHAAIAECFGYRLSIHSGSDKFVVYPIIGKYTKKAVHVKTAGTNWLEALRVISRANPALFRKIFEFALERFAEARKYYHVTTNIHNIPSLSMLTDNQLDTLLDHNDARQLLHITYGEILRFQDLEGEKPFRKAIYECLNSAEELYYGELQRHIGKHLMLLGNY